MGSIKITVDRIQPGLHVRLPVKWNEHPFLLNSFKIKDDAQVKVIRHLGIKHVYINPNQSDTPPLPANHVSEQDFDTDLQVSLEAERMWKDKHESIETLSSYRRRVSHCEKEFERSLARMRSVMTKIRNRPLDAVGEVKALVDDIVETLVSDDNATLHLMNAKADFEDIYFHTLNVSVVALMIGKAKGYNTQQLKDLSFAALFHDIGKIKIPVAILRKQSALTAPEENYLKLHTKYGADIVSGIDDFPESAKKVITQHHEMNDGSGYPEGLKEQDIDELAKIVAVANAFDNLCHGKTQSQQKIPYLALSHLYKNCKHLYSQDNLSLLVKFMGVYPPGTVVQLSNESIGIVISVNAKHMLYPNVLIYDPSVPRTQAPIIDLFTKEIKIVNAVNPSKLPEQVREYLNPRARLSYFFDTGE
ncbi:HD-GYP domain-containing protein [Vibrio splendidus]|uniref:HD-GYP domain-containing protein n=1 Tax=Vibrio splendidus TaxID=29497 RepID=UPI000C855F0A|nr:HD-GYP domain-containing protein [Vibrio splendidus]PMH09508.1 HD family phosphohydrolase [Vibrio splendidus]PMI78430.1 HD family phosphohydrolase [Vibrio splendidus]PMK52654.1 HD family phosphohydrolase [Vibrio splendidus]